MYHILFYHFIEDYVKRRAAYRTDHLEYANQTHERGKLVIAGALDNPAKDAILVFKFDPAIIEKFVENDPYFKNGLILKWEIRPFNIAIGSL
jgi:uncharacterized protein